MTLRSIIFLALTLSYAANSGYTQGKVITFEIDNETWSLVRDAPLCKDRVNFAIAEYWEMPLYAPWRSAEADRFLVNESSDCWVELYISGVDGYNPIFKVAADGAILDKRMLSSWGPRITPYPNMPIMVD